MAFLASSIALEQIPYAAICCCTGSLRKPPRPIFSSPLYVLSDLLSALHSSILSNSESPDGFLSHHGNLELQLTSLGIPWMRPTCLPPIPMPAAFTRSLHHSCTMGSGSGRPLFIANEMAKAEGSRRDYGVSCQQHKQWHIDALGRDVAIPTVSQYFHVAAVATRTSMAVFSHQPQVLRAVKHCSS